MATTDRVRWTETHRTARKTGDATHMEDCAGRTVCYEPEPDFAGAYPVCAPHYPGDTAADLDAARAYRCDRQIHRLQVDRTRFATQVNRAARVGIFAI